MCALLNKSTKALIKQILPEVAVKNIITYRRKQQQQVHARPNSYQGQHTYTVVTPVYNVESYLDDFFTSLFNQTLTKEQIRIIAVDDGSTDDSASKIHHWQQLWPNAITYLKKENGGQASARNLGIKHVETEWVTFIDPDDFVSRQYFEEVDKALKARPSLQMISCNLHFYQEEEATYKNTHPLRNRYSKGNVFFAVGDENCHIELSMAHVFFRTSVIQNHNLALDVTIRPSFEDGNFVNKYLLSLSDGCIGFLSKPLYYYRKRAAGNSTLDTMWTNPEKLSVQPKQGYLDLLLFAESQKGFIPRNIKNTVLYDMQYIFKYFTNHPERSVVAQKAGIVEDFFATARQIFELIGSDVIFSAPGRWLNFGYKYGIAQYFLNETPPYSIAYLTRVSIKGKFFIIETCGNDISFFLNGQLISPLESKCVSYSFLDKTLYHRYEHIIPFENENQILSYRASNHIPVDLSIMGKRYPESIGVKTLIKTFTKNWKNYPQQGDTWIVMDRDIQGDDNGEHFYRYMMKHHPDQRCLFILRKESPHWDRLKQEGFNLVAFDSNQHKKELRACSKIISSHANGYVHSYFGDNYYKSKDFIFLQHGITKDDLSSWLNRKPISLFITSTPAEYHSIADDGSPYAFTKRQVLLSGLPRYDSLLLRKTSTKQEPLIFIVPTWRNSLMGKSLGMGDERSLNPDFPHSTYVKNWRDFLYSSEIKKIVDSNTAKVVFFPHVNILPYIKDGLFDIPSYIQLGSCEQTSIQDYICAASVCITDYSSVAFDVAYLGTPCIYYQFDQEEFFGGEQVYAKGYFDYERDGFGPVAVTQKEALSALQDIIDNDFAPLPQYKQRIDETFIFRDGKCCERVYHAIKALDEPYTGETL